MSDLMNTKKATPDTIHNYVKELRAGDTIILAAGQYKQPLVIDGAIGTKDNPIIIRSESKVDNLKAILCGTLSEDDARRWLNDEAAQREKAGFYPAIGYMGEQAFLTLRNCQYIVIEGMNFESCWPTAIYIDRSQNILINDIDFKSGTFAIGANGIETRDIVVQHCKWQQDTSLNHKMWDVVPWSRIHGAKNNGNTYGVNILDDYRHWDGDFFRGWNVGGNIIIRNNKITDAFNAIHFFNSHDKLAPGEKASAFRFNGGRQSTSNILIENNTFIRIRDNVFEPEDHAWNWVIRHNHLYDCYRPFSLEFMRAGFIYIYGNRGAFINKATTNASSYDQDIFAGELRQKPSLFKPKGKQENEGRLYVFNNSWYMKVGKGIYPKFGLGKFISSNNAMQFSDPDRALIFGKNGDKQTKKPIKLEAELEAEKGRFTRRWQPTRGSDLPVFDIVIDGEMGNDKNFPEKYKRVGYKLGIRNTSENPNFKSPESLTNPDFFPQNTNALNAAIPLKLELPNDEEPIFFGG